jgi:eukaryotic-like serine/threonine-protein kinase
MSSSEGPCLTLGRYVVFDEFASGGMASVHLGRMQGPVGFSRTIAVKRLHPQFARDRAFAKMFVDEARLASRIRHPNVVSTLDVVLAEKEVCLVLEYVHGLPLSALLEAARAKKQQVPVGVALNIMLGTLSGLHAAHTALSDAGEPLGIVHRDVSPQNILVGSLGVAQLVDFGVAKANQRLHESTGEGSLKGKLAYMAPEQLEGREVDARADIYSASVVTWELLTGRRFVSVREPAAIVAFVMNQVMEPPSRWSEGCTPEIDRIVLQGLVRDRDQRFSTAEEMASALERAAAIASNRDVARWVESVAGDQLTERAALVLDVERLSPAEAPATATAAVENAVMSQPVPVMPAAPARRRGWLAAGVVLALTLGLGTALAFRARGEPATTTPSTQPPSVASSTPALLASSAPALLAAPSASAAPISDSAPVARTNRASRTTTAPTKKSCDAPANCRPPYRLGANNQKEFKSECVPYLRCFDH